MLEASPCLCFKEILGFSILSRMRSPTSPGSSVPSRATNSTHPQHWRSQCRRSIPSLPFNWNVPGQMQQLTFTDYSWFEFIPCLRLRLADCFFFFPPTRVKDTKIIFFVYIFCWLYHLTSCREMASPIFCQVYCHIHSSIWSIPSHWSYWFNVGDMPLSLYRYIYAYFFMFVP